MNYKMDNTVETVNKSYAEVCGSSNYVQSRENAIIPNDWQISNLFAENMLLVRPQIVPPTKFVEAVQSLENLFENKPFHSIIITNSDRTELEFQSKVVQYFSINDQQNKKTIAAHIKAFTNFQSDKYAVLLVKILREHNTIRLCNNIFDAIDAGLIKYLRNEHVQQINDSTLNWINKRSPPFESFYLDLLWQYKNQMQDTAFRYFCAKMGVTPKHFDTSVRHGPTEYTQSNLQIFDPLHALMKEIRIVNPVQNCWKRIVSGVNISNDELQASMDNVGHLLSQYVFASKGFSVFRQFALENSLEIYYFEVKLLSTERPFYIGLSSTSCSPTIRYGFNSRHDYCYLAGNKCSFQWPDGAIKPEYNGTETVTGCGILMSGTKQMAIFFTVHGILMGKPIPIIPPGELLFPTIRIFANMCLEGNFGDNPSKPFAFDLKKCPALKFE